MNPSPLVAFGFLAATAPVKVTVPEPTSSIGWFDGIVIVMLIIGLLRGRKRGMSGEVLDLIQWLSILVGGGLLNEPVGEFLARFANLSVPMARLLVYVVFALLLKLLFSMFKGSIGKHLVGSEMFGGLEYYLGMLAGVTRYLCMALAIVAILNAWDITEAEVKARREAQTKELGKVYFPPIIGIQYDICRNSFVGTTVRQDLPMLVISPSRIPAPHKENPVLQHERDIDALLGTGRTNVTKPGGN